MTLVAKGQTVTFRCLPFLENGDPLGNQKEEPLVLTAGSKGNSRLSNTLSTVIVGMGLLETKKYKVPAKFAFGDFDPNRVFKLSLEEPNDHKVGDELDLKVTTESGSSIKKGRILCLEQGNAEVDTNHPLAGENLIVEIKILAINETRR